jgi:hypothetical protein
VDEVGDDEVVILHLLHHDDEVVDQVLLVELFGLLHIL